MEERSQGACPHCGVLLEQHEGACGTRRNLFVKGENDMTIDNEIRPRQKRPKNPVRVSVSKDIHQEVEDWTLFDPWEGALDILCSKSPLEMVRHPLGWVIVNYTNGIDYRVCDGPYATRTEARQAVGEWTEVRRMLEAEKEKRALEEPLPNNC
jgi:hypothetical protein